MRADPPIAAVSPEAIEPLDAPVLAAVHMAAASVLHAGVIDDRANAVGDSSGSGRDHGAGVGQRGGAGDGDGLGVGPGRQAGTGGSEIHRAGNGVTAPRLIHSPPPAYTSEAMKARISGHVLLECVVQPDGRIGRIRILRSLDSVYGLDDQAIKAVRAWRFIPGTLHGQAVSVLVTIETSFAIH